MDRGTSHRDTGRVTVERRAHLSGVAHDRPAAPDTTLPPGPSPRRREATKPVGRAILREVPKFDQDAAIRTRQAPSGDTQPLRTIVAGDPARGAHVAKPDHHPAADQADCRFGQDLQAHRQRHDRERAQPWMDRRDIAAEGVIGKVEIIGRVERALGNQFHTWGMGNDLAE